MAIITAPVSLEAVNGIVGGGYTSINGQTVIDLGTMIRNGNINKWAKYKPVIYASVNTLNQLVSGEWTDTYNSWWKATNGNCGISYITFSTMADLISAITNKTAVWSYVRPSGGQLSPYRLTDFYHYDHNASAPIVGLAVSVVLLKAGAKMTVQVGKAASYGYNLTLFSLGGFTNYYFTVAVYEGSTFKFVYSDSTKLGDHAEADDIEIEIPYSDATIGGYNGLSKDTEYKLYIFLSNVRYQNVQWTLPTGMTVVPLPYEDESWGLQPATFKPTDSSSWIFINAYASSSVVSWTAEVYGAGNNVTGTIRLIDLNGNIVSGQSHEISFTDGTQVESAGTTGYRKRSSVSTTLFIPTGDSAENYMVEFVAISMNQRAIIGHDVE